MTSIPLVCPACQTPFPLEAGLQDVAARQALIAALSLWPEEYQPSLLTYLGLFKPPQRALAWPKLARLVRELVELIRKDTVTRHRETRPASPAHWAAGLEAVLAMRDAGTLTLPLTGHGLLVEIVHRQAGQAQAQDAARHKPLHPSHRPAPFNSAPFDSAQGTGAGGSEGRSLSAAEGSTNHRQAGLAAVGELTAALRRHHPPTQEPS